MDGKFPNAETVMKALVAPFGYGCTYIPAPASKFEELMPVIWVARNGGNRDEITDRPQVSVAVFALDYQTASDTAEDVRDAILDSPGRVYGGALIDTATETTARTQAPDIDPKVYMVTASFRLSYRRSFT